MWHRFSYVLAGLLLALAFPSQGQAQGETQAVREAATQVLSSRYPGSAAHLDVRVRRVRGSVDTAKALQVRFSGSEGTPTGPAQVDLRVRGAGGEWEKVGWALLQVARLDSVVTIQGRVKRGETIPRSKLETAWLETTDLPGEPLRAADVRKRAGEEALVAARHVQSGRVLRERDVRLPYTANTGTSIQIRHRHEGILFRLSCKAREPGFLDDVIRVHCPDTNKMYRARLTSEHKARWIETL